MYMSARLGPLCLLELLGAFSRMEALCKMIGRKVNHTRVAGRVSNVLRSFSSDAFRSYIEHDGEENGIVCRPSSPSLQRVRPGNPRRLRITAEPCTKCSNLDKGGHALAGAHARELSLRC